MYKLLITLTGQPTKTETYSSEDIALMWFERYKSKADVESLILKGLRGQTIKKK